MSMIKYLKLPVMFNSNLMQDEVRALLLKDWKLHYNTQDYEGEWSALPLRSAGGSLTNVIAHSGDAVSFADTVLMQSCPYIEQVTASFLCPKLSVRLLKLKAGAVIHAHSDKDLYFEEGEMRLHIPIFTNPLVEFFLDDERIWMQEGECWYMNLSLMHRLNNKSRIDRVHLVIDCEVNDWVKAQFDSPLVSTKKHFAGIEPKQANVVKLQLAIHELRKMGTVTANEMADKLEQDLKDNCN